MRLFILFVLLASSSAFASGQNCTSVLALSKVVSTVVSDRDSLEKHASNFCSENSRVVDGSSSASFGASYKFLSASLGNSSASREEVASKYCSASNGQTSNRDAYLEYIQSISPGAYGAYEQCVRLSEQDLRFNLDAGSVLPNQFSMSVGFSSSTATSKAAKVAYSASQGISCKWGGSSAKTINLKSGTSALFECRRSDATIPGFVKIARTDHSVTEMTLPWQAFTKDGVPVATIRTLKMAINQLQGRLEESDKKIAALSLFKTMKVYKCPVGTNGWNPSGTFLTIGCVGQISVENECRNVAGQQGGSSIDNKLSCTPAGEILLLR
jgi:hypothetical protein